VCVQVVSRLLADGTIALAVSALEWFGDHVEVQEGCMSGIDSLLQQSFEKPFTSHPPGWAKRGIPSLVTAVITAMRRFPNSPTAQSGGCVLIWRLTAKTFGVQSQLRDKSSTPWPCGPRTTMSSSLASSRWGNS
jgi:hypothetical protein